jgi:hypothetical protein
MPERLRTGIILHPPRCRVHSVISRRGHIIYFIRVSVRVKAEKPPCRLLHAPSLRLRSPWPRRDAAIGWSVAGCSCGAVLGQMVRPLLELSVDM